MHRRPQMYVALFPCNDCAKLIIQSGIREVIFQSDKYHSDAAFVASRRLLGLAGVATRQHVPQRESVVLQLRVQ
jgi:dCMP deaminase